MDELIYYLELKNQFYEKFHSITEKLLHRANANQWDEIAFFVDNRERVLNIIRSFDAKIAQLSQKMGDFTDIEMYRTKVQHILLKRESLGAKIIAQDLELISKLEEARMETIQELKTTLEVGQKLQSFSSAQPTTKKTKTTKDI
jgi:hypothetical protein